MVIDDVAVVKTGDALLAAGVPAQAEWTSTTSLDLLESDQLVVRGSYGVPPALDPVEVLVRFDLDGAGAAVNPVVVRQAGDLIAGRSVLGVASALDTSWTVNSGGQVLSTLSLGGGGIGIPAGLAIVLDGTILIEHDKPSPVPRPAPSPTWCWGSRSWALRSRAACSAPTPTCCCSACR